MFETDKYNFLFECQASDRIILTLDNKNNCVSKAECFGELIYCLQ